jgi:hypothetical protein
MRAVARAAIGCGKFCSALDQEYRELAEHIQIDWAYIGALSVYFKSQVEAGEPAQLFFGLTPCENDQNRQLIATPLFVLMGDQSKPPFWESSRETAIWLCHR